MRDISNRSFNLSMDDAIVKTEVEQQDVRELGGEGRFGFDHSVMRLASDNCCSSSSEVMARPMEGLKEAGLAPFLKKTFEMVEDERSDGVVSWSGNGKSFIVWDQHGFSTDLLPVYFKHSNFSSFIRQLNTYGFRKIDSERWDFAHEFFQRGKKPLLKQIKRRPRPNHPSCRAVSDCKNRRAIDIKADAENLKRDQENLRVEIIKVRQQQDTSHKEISAIDEQVLCAETRLQNMFVFLTKAEKNPNFVQQLMQRKRSSDRLEILKPDILEYGNNNSGSPELTQDGGEVIGDRKMVPSGLAVRGFSNTISSKACKVVSEDLLGESGAVENDAAMEESGLYVEFEGLIREKSRDWDGYGKTFLDEAAVGLTP